MFSFFKRLCLLSSPVECWRPAMGRWPSKSRSVCRSEMNNDYFVTMKQALDQAAADIGAKVYVADAHDVAKQIGDVEDMLQKKVDILLINPTDSVGVQSAVISAHKAGAVVVAIDAGRKGRWIRSSARKTTTPASGGRVRRKRWAAKARWRSSTASRWCRSRARARL